MWNGDELDLDAYLARIGYTGELAPDLGTLYAVHRAHTAAIPFESLDVLLGRPIALDVKSLENKLVRSSRGGYCYEHNSLLAAALQRIGFEVAGRGARNRTRGDAVMPVTHAALVVTVGGEPYLADCGFGANGLLEPLPLHAGAEAAQGRWRFALAEEAEGVLVLRSRRDGEEWRDLYAFSPQRLYPVDFGVMNHYSSTHPASFFTGRLTAMRPGAEERVAVVQNELVRFRPEGTDERHSVTPDELLGLLDREFGIRLPVRDAEQLLCTYRSED
ncbi:arylamine N-acetyltransferase [Streptomyces sp. NPDC002054]|uniref:arylamine N-acetyltransferase family protein n=1 Tax=Streptomyces sp. NPDC002054 TaxID=3154663 RepID=UPI0033244106